MKRLPRRIKKRLKKLFKNRYKCNWLKSNDLIIEYNWFFKNPYHWDMTKVLNKVK